MRIHDNRGKRLSVAWLRLAGVCALLWSGVAHADAPHDIVGGMRLWLDGLDVNATDAGNGGGTNPASGVSVTQWKDKSANGRIAGDATSFGANAHSFPTYSSNAGVSFNGISNVLEITSGIYGVGTTVSNSDILAVATTRTVTQSFLFTSGAPRNSGSRISVHLPWSDGSLFWDHGSFTTGRQTVTWAGTLNRAYLYSFGASLAGSQSIVRDGASIASKTNSASYVQQATDVFFLGGGDAGINAFHDGIVSEILIYSRRLLTAEKNILSSYLAAKHANPGGAGTANKYTNTAGYRYHVGGIGAEADGWVAAGTSAGLTLTNVNFLAAGKYVLAGTSALNPPNGVTTADVPAGYALRSQRVWYLFRTGTAAGDVSLTFNLAQMGINLNAGKTVGLVARAGATGTFSLLAASTYTGSGSIAFTLNAAANLINRYYALAVPGDPVLGLALAHAPVSDGVSASNFKTVPGALIKATAAISNSGTGSPDANSTMLTLSIPANTKFYLGDIAGAGTGPVQFVQGATNSGLNYTYTSLASTADSLDFSNNSGASWTYAPVADVQQCDAAITTIRVRPAGTFGAGTAPNYPSFTVNYGLLVK